MHDQKNVKSCEIVLLFVCLAVFRSGDLWTN